MNPKKFQRRIKRTRNRGWALVAVITLSLFASMFLFSIAGLSTTLLRSEGVSRQRNYALAAAEAGLDFALCDLTKLLKGEISELAQIEGTPYEVPTRYLPQLGNRCRVMIRVRRLTDAEYTWVNTYRSQAIPAIVNPLNKSPVDTWRYGMDWTQFALPNDEPCWSVEVTSYCGIFATSIRSILVPASGAPSSSSTTTNPYDRFFPEAIVANGDVQIGTADQPFKLKSITDPQVKLGESESSYKSVVQTNGRISVEQGGEVFGDLRVSNPDGADPTSTKLALGDRDSTIIHGRVETNGFSDTSINPFSGLQPTEPGAELKTDTGNIYADADIASLGERTGINQTPSSTSPIINPESPNAISLPPNTAPLPPFPAALPYFVDNPSYLPDGTVPVDTSYRTPSLDSSEAQGPLVFNKGGANSLPTQVFVVPDPASTGAESTINLKSQFFVNEGQAADLQIFYSGSNDVTLQIDGSESSPGKLSLVIYAPFAKVTTTGIGDFSGAIFGKQVSLTHRGDILIDTNALNIKANNSNAGSGGAGSEDSTSRASNHYRISTWEQVSGRLVPLAGG